MKNKIVVYLSFLLIFSYFFSCTQPDTVSPSGTDTPVEAKKTKVSIVVRNADEFKNCSFEIKVSADGTEVDSISTIEDIITGNYTFEKLSVVVNCYDASNNLIATGELKNTKNLIIIITLVKIDTEPVVPLKPVMSPEAGVYNRDLFAGVTITADATADAVYYTIDDTNPDSSKTLYTGTIALTQTTTVKAVSFRNGVYSVIAQSLYELTDDSVVSPVQFSIEAGTYPLETFQGIVLTSDTKDAEIRYTLDGSIPDSSSILYTKAILFDTANTYIVKAIAFKNGSTASSVSSGEYVIEDSQQPIVANPIVFPAAGTYTNTSFSGVTLTTDEAGSQIYYTIDGSNPDKTKTLYSKQIVFSETTTIKAVVYKDGVYSAVVTALYTLTKELVVSPVQFSIADGTYLLEGFKALTLTTTTENSEIRYTIDGSVPSATSLLYTTALPYTKAGTYEIKAIALKSGFITSTVTAVKFTIEIPLLPVLEKPIVTPAEGTYKINDFPGVTIQPEANVQFRYTVDGSEPTESSPLYTAKIELKTAGVYTVKIKNFRSGYTSYVTVTKVYTIINNDIPTVKTPVVSPANGTYTISDFLGFTVTPDTGVTFRYTLDGSEPTETSAVYTEKLLFSVKGSYTVKTKGFKAECLASETVTRLYTIIDDIIIVTPPSISPVSGTYKTTEFPGVTITTKHEGASTYYTMDGSAPSKTSLIYTAPITLVEGTFTVKAISYLGDNYSTVTSAAYKIEEPVDGINIYVKTTSAPAIWVWETTGTKIECTKGMGFTWDSQPSMIASTGMNDNTGWFMFNIPSTYVSGGAISFILNKGSEIKTTKMSTFWYDNGTFYDEDPTAPVVTTPVIVLTPAGGNFTGATTTVTITVTDATSSKYSTDGTDAKNGTAFTGTTSVVIGSDMSVNSSKTIHVWAENSDGESVKSAVFTKTDKPVTPTRLGAYYTTSATTFTIWSPDSSNVTVTVDGTVHTCTSGFAVDGGYTDTAHIYGVTVPGDLKLKEYQFKIGGKNVRDPYGVMVKYDPANDAGTGSAPKLEEGANVTANTGCSSNIVMDLSETTIPWAARPALIEREDAVIYEISISDFTISANSGVTAAKKGKYLGMVESGTTYNGVKTGIDHLKELGVTHVQIMPFYDFSSKNNQSTNQTYNWGYDPVNYNVPEERFSQNPADYAERIREVKTMVNEFHKAGIRVIMDVVYNHTFWDEMFMDISSKYYIYLNGVKANASGCGNGVDTSNAMVSRFIRDSLDYWLEEYNIDGFRFDLMAIYKTDAVNSWGEYLNEKYSDRNILMYGEPWTGMWHSDTAGRAWAASRPVMSNGHIGSFNGGFRESIKGGNDDTTGAFIFNWTEAKGGQKGGTDGAQLIEGIKGGVMGSQTSTIQGSEKGEWWMYDYVSANDPEQSINYISAHDNYALWDKVTATSTAGSGDQILINNFGTAIVMTAQGIPFMHSGDEFLRTKNKGSFASHAHNSYMWGTEMNEIDWSLKSTNSTVFNYYKDLIKLRKEHPGFRMNTLEEVNSNVTPQFEGAQLVTYINAGANGDSWSQIKVVYNSTSGTVNTDATGWTKVFDKNGFTTGSDGSCAARSMTVFKK